MKEPRRITTENPFQTSSLVFLQYQKTEPGNERSVAQSVRRKSACRPADVVFSQDEPALNNPPARRLSNCKVARERQNRTEWHLCNRVTCYFTKFIRRVRSGLSVIKRINSPLWDIVPPFLHCEWTERFRPMHQFSFNLHIVGFNGFQCEEMHRRS
jgi:hypothetical protein